MKKNKTKLYAALMKAALKAGFNKVDAAAHAMSLVMDTTAFKTPVKR